MRGSELKQLEHLLEMMKEKNGYFDEEDIAIVEKTLQNNERTLRLAQCEENINFLTLVLQERGEVLDQVGDTLLKFPELNTFFVERQTKYVQHSLNYPSCL